MRDITVFKFQRFFLVSDKYILIIIILLVIIIISLSNHQYIFYIFMHFGGIFFYDSDFYREENFLVDV